jgi:hypothetical protein
VKAHEPILAEKRLALDVLHLLTALVIRDVAKRLNKTGSLRGTVLCAAPMIGIDTFDLVA